MKMILGNTFVEVLESGTAFYPEHPGKKYQAYKINDVDFGISYAVKETNMFGRYSGGWYHRHLTDVTFIPTQTSIQLIGV